MRANLSEAGHLRIAKSLRETASGSPADVDLGEGSGFLYEPVSGRRDVGWGVPAWAALLKIAIHVPVLGRYGYHHDELYFLACGRHLSFGYVDHAPLIPWIARLMDELFGRSLFALRLPAVFAGAAAVFVTGLLVRRLGGGRLAQWIACVAMLVVPAYLRPATMLTIVAFEPLVWVTASYLLVRIADEDNPRLWIWLGLVVGIGLMTKHSTLFLGTGIAAGVVLTPMRRHLRSPWPYVGAAVALLLFLPNLVWQVGHGWPTLEFLQRLNTRIAPHINPFTFAAGQLIYMNPVTVPVWIGGLLWLFRESGRRYRVLGWIWVAAFTLLATAGSKIYYLAPAYPALLAAGAVAFERRRARTESQATPGRRWLLPRPLSSLLVGGLVVLPASVPILPLDATERYIGTLTFGLLEKAYEVTGDLHGQFGWRERVEAVADVYRSLPSDERRHAVILAGWYGPAGAIDYFGPDYGLPQASSGHMTYYLWGLPEGPITTVVAAAVPEETLERLFEEVSLAAEVEIENANPWERPFRVFVCRRPKADLHETWPELRRW